MTRTLKKAFDLGIAATVAIVILNFAASSIGIVGAETQDYGKSQPSFSQTAKFTVAAFAQ